jgi:hypothetical protein
MLHKLACTSAGVKGYLSCEQCDDNGELSLEMIIPPNLRELCIRSLIAVRLYKDVRL